MSTVTQIAQALQSPKSYDWDPAKYGLLTWTLPVELAATSTTYTTGSVLANMFILPQSGTVSTLHYRTGSAAVGPVSNQCFLGIYDYAGNLVAETGDNSANLATSTTYDVDLTTPVNLPAGNYYAAVLTNASGSSGAIRCLDGTDLINYGMSSPSYRAMACNPGVTSLPASLTGFSRHPNPFWIGIS